MGLVYPDLKPMLEASMRKVTVTVHWKEGIKDRGLTIGSVHGRDGDDFMVVAVRWS